VIPDEMRWGYIWKMERVKRRGMANRAKRSKPSYRRMNRVCRVIMESIWSTKAKRAAQYVTVGIATFPNSEDGGVSTGVGCIEEGSEKILWSRHVNQGW